MNGASRRGLRRSLVAAACLVAVATLLAGSTVARESGPRRPLRVLQLNLCGSGMSGCYTGRAVPEAAAVLRAAAPDVVTLNEVCEGDVAALGLVLSRLSGERVATGFKAAPDRRTGGATRCRNGQAYGIGLLARTPGGGDAAYSGIYPVQDLGDPEERVWLCLYSPGGLAFYACTTHLANTSAPVAVSQCRYLLDTAIPEVRGRHGYAPTVLGGDLNLRYGTPPDLRPCLPSRYLRLDDGDVQHVLATNDITVSSSASIDMNGATDHPGLLVAMTLPDAG